MVSKTHLMSILDDSGFGVATEMGVFALDKGLEVSLVPEPFCTYIFKSSALVVAADKISVSTTFVPYSSLNTKPQTLLLLLLQSLQIYFLPL